MYTTIEQAKEILSKRYDISEISDVELDRALYLAFDKIENLHIRDSGRSNKQDTHFPRVYEKEVPKEIIKAMVLEAYAILINDSTLDDITNNIASKSIGDMSISYNKPYNHLQGFKSKDSINILYKYVRKTYGY